MSMNTIRRGIELVLLTAATSACYGAIDLEPNDASVVLANHSLAAPDPSQRGPYTVKHLYYGSGNDKQRAVYRDSVAFKTKTVDMSKLVVLEGDNAKSREKYWGFTMKKAPVNGRVWYPDAPGPFPLVLIVHGNHDMEDYSDPGYEYLGELLASRGYIFVSVDENFMNGGISRENDGRGAMLLEHVRAWHGFNADTANPFHGKVDVQNVALMGHSRGGEAVGHAASFNHLTRDPDDATIKFDYNFPLKTIIAIAPVDGQYKPSSRFEPVENVNYLVFHGSHDGDVSTFHGLRQYQRVQFTDGEPHVKAAVYVYRANHGQWNTIWNNHDNGPRSGRILDLRGLISGAEQRKFAEVYVSAFLDATLRNDKRYLPMFRDHRVAGEWLPKTMYINRFEENTFKPVANFEEDVDVTTGSIHGVTLRGDSLASWKENGITYRSRGSDPQNNQAVWIGWNNRLAGKDTTKFGPDAKFTVTLSDSVVQALKIDRASTLMFSMAGTDTKPGPRALPDTAKKDTTAKATKTPKTKAEIAAARKAAAEKKAADKREADAKKAADKKAAEAKKKADKAAGIKTPKGPENDTTKFQLMIEAVDRAGNTARVPLSSYGVLRHPLNVKTQRLEGQDKKDIGTTNETVLQTFTVPMADFINANNAFDASRLDHVSFVFTPTFRGTIVLDEIGFAKLDPSYFAGGR
jgi:dienelactone hydrolase